MYDENYSSWDTGLFDGSDPDIYFKITDSYGSVLYTSATKQNVGSSLMPVTWQSINVTLNYSSTYYIKFYDSDGGVDSDDIMVNCIFNSSYLTSGGSSYIWEASDGTVKFTVGLTWS